MDTSFIQYLIGPAGAAGLCLLFIMLGLLVTKREYRRVCSENEQLKRANDILLETNQTLREANRDLAASGQLINSVVTVLGTIAQEHRGVIPDTQAPKVQLTQGHQSEVP